MTTRNLWGELPEPDAFRPPARIFKEQAAVLSDLTKGILSGKVLVARQRDNISVELRIVAPALSGYEFLIVIAYHKMNGYPAYIRSAVEHDGDPVECADEETFERELSAILRSEPIKRAIVSLLAQSEVT